MNNLPSPDLYDRIINNINHEHKLLLLKRRLILYSGILLLSAGSLIPLIKNLLNDLYRSDFLEISSLLITDFKLVLANLGDFALSVLGSAPLTSFVLSGFLFICLIYSLGKLIGLLQEYNKYDRPLV
jgi:hypothetical protein